VEIFHPSLAVQKLGMILEKGIQFGWVLPFGVDGCGLLNNTKIFDRALC
jgi:hypothetical protein